MSAYEILDREVAQPGRHRRRINHRNRRTTSSPIQLHDTIPPFQNSYQAMQDSRRSRLLQRRRDSTRTNARPTSLTSRSTAPPVPNSGLFKIQSDLVTDISGQEDLELKIYRDSARGVWWAAFRWGSWQGLMLIHPGTRHDKDCAMGYRIRRLDAGRTSHVENGRGVLSFSEDGRNLEGTMWGPLCGRNVLFVGSRVDGYQMREDDDLQDEWEGYEN